MARSAMATVRSLDRNPVTDPEASRLPADAGASPTARRLLLAALDLFAARGYHGTSIRDVAGLAGAKSATLYSHFASKEDILASLVFLGHDLHHRRLLAALVEAGPDPRQQLASMMRAHVEVHCRYTELAVVATRERHHLSAGALAPAAALRRSSEELVYDVVDRGVRQGVFHVPDFEATLVAIGSMGIAVADWYPGRADRLTPEEVGAAYSRIALRMLGADGYEGGAS